MPRLNLKDEGLGTDDAPETMRPSSPSPMLREVGGGGGRISPIILILLILVVLAGGIFALNHFKVIHLWGKKAPVVTETLPEPDLPPATPEVAPAEGAAGGATGSENLPLPSVSSQSPATSATREPATLKPAATSAPSGSGRYTVQFSAWMSRAKAETEAQLLASAGYDAYVDDAVAGGDHWYQVRVGRFDSRSQAQETVAKLQPMTEEVVWVAVLR
jgi:hypothetical protein